MGKIAIYFPTRDGDVPPYLQNIFDKVSGGLDAKYSIALGDVTLIQTHKTNIVTAIDKSVSDRETAQASTNDKNQKINDAKIFILKLLNDVQDHGSFEEQDAEDLGMRVYKEPVDLNTVKPEVSRITVLPDKVILDWIKYTLDGVIIESSYDGVTFTKIGQDTHSPFEDTRSNVSEGAETRYYRLRYFENDVAVGHFSDVVKVVCSIT
jgi:hypothetical protein